MKYKIIKRTTDIIFSLISLIIISPILIVTSFIILVASGSPIFYMQKRIGKNEKKFKIYKFRTLKKNAKELEKQGFDTDELTIPFGKTLRIFHIDELPQLINILKGDMSFIGSRPIIPEEYYTHKKMNPKYNKIMKNKPGLTSMNNALGYMEDERRYKTMGMMGLKYTCDKEYHEKTSPEYSRKLAEREFYYLNHCSFALDAKIAWWTLLLEIDAVKKFLIKKKENKVKTAQIETQIDSLNK